MKRYFPGIVLLVTVLGYLSVFVSPGEWWPATLVSAAIPFLIAYHLVVFVFFLRKGFSRVWTNATALLLGIPFLLSTFGLSFFPKSEGSLRVLSYNVNGFRHHENFSVLDEKKAFPHWMYDHSADIKVFQEFYTELGSKERDHYQRIIDKGYYGYIEPLSGARNHMMGLVIFSRFPIINKGVLLPIHRPIGRLNNIIFADIVIRKDTVRVYNAHLQSMGIDPNHVMEAEQLKAKYASIGKKFVAGAIARAAQVDVVTAHIQACPYPVILAGDLNEMPYSYAYMKFRRLLGNAFEARGRGFAFSMNSRMWFLRIDNIFYDKSFWTARTFKTLNEVKFSDHFPIEATFDLK